MRTRTLRISLVIGALIVPGACDDFEGTPTAPSSTAPSVTALTISGNTSINPGGTTRLTATATYSDNRREDVTAEAFWSSTTEVAGVRVLSVISPGVIRGDIPGKATVRAEYGRASTNSQLRVAPDGAFLLTVAVSDHGFASDAARVQVTSPAGTFSATTDLWGVVMVPAVGDATLQVEKPGLRTTTMSLSVSADQTVDIVLQPSDTA
jgi:hypothetical protein